MKRIIVLKTYKKRKIGFMAVILVLIGIFFTTMMLKNSKFAININKKLPIYSVDTKEKKVAITFDTNWGGDFNKILKILDENNVKATFFVLGIWVDQHNKEIKDIFKDGHEIGNHSDTHPDFTRLSKEKIIKEINNTDKKIMDLVGVKTSVFRFPSGAYNEKAIEDVESTKHFCIQWDADSVDWKEQGADIEYKRVIKKVKPGSILLFHNASKYTPETLPRIIKTLKEKGYKFVKISDLIYKNNYYIDNMGKQKLN